MIFISVGTHEQGFERLVKEVDRLKGGGIIKDEVFIQLGYTKYVPKYCGYVDMLTYASMIDKIKTSSIYITHGGPASIYLGLENGIIPIVVPRMREFEEHVDNHQVRFAERLEQNGKIIAVYKIESLEKTILQYDDLMRKFKTASSNEKNIHMLTEKLSEYCEHMIKKAATSA